MAADVKVGRAHVSNQRNGEGMCGYFERGEQSFVNLCIGQNWTSWESRASEMLAIQINAVLTRAKTPERAGLWREADK